MSTLLSVYPPVTITLSGGQVGNKISRVMDVARDLVRDGGEGGDGSVKVPVRVIAVSRSIGR